MFKAFFVDFFVDLGDFFALLFFIGNGIVNLLQDDGVVIAHSVQVQRYRSKRGIQNTYADDCKAKV